MYNEARTTLIILWLHMETAWIPWKQVWVMLETFKEAHAHLRTLGLLSKGTRNRVQWAPTMSSYLEGEDYVQGEAEYQRRSGQWEE